jgi:hypothetical protein
MRFFDQFDRKLSGNSNRTTPLIPKRAMLPPFNSST